MSTIKDCPPMHHTGGVIRKLERQTIRSVTSVGEVSARIAHRATRTMAPEMPTSLASAYGIIPSLQRISPALPAPTSPSQAEPSRAQAWHHDRTKTRTGAASVDARARANPFAPRLTQSGRRDSNPRPPEPHSGALPDCATSRLPRQCCDFSKDTRPAGPVQPAAALRVNHAPTSL